MNEQGLYIPSNCLSLSCSVNASQERYGFQGSPGCGKTWLALGFPNPIIANFDRNLNAHAHRSDVYEIPFHDGKFCDSIVKRDGILAPPNRKDALLVWLSKEGTKLSKNQTLIVDSGKQVEHAYHTWYRQNPQISKTGEENKFAEFRLKMNFYNDMAELFKEIKANIIYICHETPDRDDKGNLTGLNRPLISGQIGDAIASDFTDWYRILAVAKPVDDILNDRFKKKFLVDDRTLVEWKKSTTNDTIYICQTQSDEICKCKTSLVNVPKYILASYDTFSKYKRQLTTKDT